MTVNSAFFFILQVWRKVKCYHKSPENQFWAKKMTAYWLNKMQKEDPTTRIVVVEDMNGASITNMVRQGRVSDCRNISLVILFGNNQKLIEICSCVWKQFSIAILETHFWNLVYSMWFLLLVSTLHTLVVYVGQTSDKLCGHQEQPFVNRVCMKFEYITKVPYSRNSFLKSCLLKSWSWGVFNWSFDRFWVRVGRLNDLTSQTLLRRLDLVFTSADSPCYSHWYAPPCICDRRATKLPNSCSGNHVCTWVVCAEPLISVCKVCNSKRYSETCFTNASTNEIFLPSENAHTS